jgi:hypothetical protein
MFDSLGGEMKTWWEAVAGYPPTWVVAIVSVGSVVAFLQLLEPPGPMAIVGVVVGVVGLVSWPILLAVTGTLSRLQFQLHEPNEADAEALRRLADELATLDDPRPAQQLAALTENRDSLIGVLNKRLEAGEMTYARYVGTAQAVYLGALDNLSEVAIATESVSGIDGQRIRTRLAEIERSPEATDDAERGSLTDRLELLHRQHDRISRLLAQNEEALTVIVSTATALADAPIGKVPGAVEDAMVALREMADRAGKYAFE